MTADSHALTTEHSPVASLPHDARGGIGNPVLGMLLFLTSEVMFFAGLFAAYFSVRANAPGGLWPPINPDTNEQYFLQFLPFVLPATILLILSSFTAQFAVWAIRRGDRTGFLRNLSVTVLLGSVGIGVVVLDVIALPRHRTTSSLPPRSASSVRVGRPSQSPATPHTAPPQAFAVRSASGTAPPATTSLR